MFEAIRRRKALIITALILLVLVAIASGPCYLHNRFLAGMDAALGKVPLPPLTHEIGTYSIVGNLHGVSNQCNYVVRRFVSTMMEPTEFRAAIGKPTITVGGERGPVSVIYLGRADLAFEDFNSYIFVLEASTSSLPSWDMRCN